ncbi:MAG: TIM barrel protein [Armatimonadetes bacterium]|nr:TIM barrel protein [Armatimonadota bacterium]
MPEPRIKQSACWGCFCREGVTPEQFVKTAAEVGYRSIEMGPQEHWDLIKAHGLEIAIFVGHKSLTDGLNDPSNHDRIEDELNASLDLAVEYGVPTLLCLSGNRRGMSDEEGLGNCADCLRRVVPAAEARGIALAVELLNSKVNHPDYMCDRTAWGVELCNRVGSPHVKLVYDIYHMQIMEGDLIRTITGNIDYIAHFHTAGNPGRRDLDDEQEIYYPAVMRAIAESGYTGYVSHEFLPKADPMEALRAAFETCDV